MITVIPEDLLLRDAIHTSAMKKGVLYPERPERICWGCERYCAANDLACGNGTIRTPHPRELFGDDWREWALRDDAREARVDQGGTRIEGAACPPTASHDRTTEFR